MSQLKPKYWTIFKEALDRIHVNKHDIQHALSIAIQACQALADQALADKPVVELTDAEIAKVWDGMGGRFLCDFGYLQFARAIEDAAIAKQSEPKEAPFDYNEWRKGGWQAGYWFSAKEWCEVTVIDPEKTYTMRRIP
jgi:hypothetical protein